MPCFSGRPQQSDISHRCTATDDSASCYGRRVFLFVQEDTSRAIALPKVKQIISGGFRTRNGADTFCTIRAYLATLHKQGTNHRLCAI